MLSLSVATIVLLATAGAVQMDDAQPNQAPMSAIFGQQPGSGPLGNLGMLGGNNQPGANLLNGLPGLGQQSGGLLGGLGAIGGNGQPHGGLLGGLTRMLGGDAQQQQPGGFLGGLAQPNGLMGGLGQQQAGGPLGNLLNGNPAMSPNQLLGALGQNQSQNGLGEMLMQLPRHGMDLVRNLLTGMRNMIPTNASMNGMGRDQSMLRNPMQQGQNLINRLPAPLNQLDLSATDNLRRAVTEPLSQGRLPNMDQVSGELRNTVSDMTRSLSRGMSSQGGMPSMDQVSGQLSRTASDIGQSLSRGMSSQGGMPSIDQVPGQLMNTVSDMAQSLNRGLSMPNGATASA